MTARPLLIAEASDAKLQKFVDVFALLNSMPRGAAEAFLTGLRQTLGERFAEHVLLLERDGRLVGGAVLRPSPRRGHELVGGAVPSEDRAAQTRVLLEAACARAVGLGASAVSAYANEATWNTDSLATLGFEVVAHFERLQGPPPLDLPTWPAGFTSERLTKAERSGDVFTALHFYEDLWGHHAVSEEHVRASLTGEFARASVLLYDPEGRVAGIVRASLEGGEGSVDAPGVRLDLRGANLYVPLFLSASALLRGQGARTLAVECWGEAPEVVASYAALGLEVIEREPIVARFF